MRRLIQIIIVFTIILTSTALYITGSSCSHSNYSSQIETITIAAVPTELNALAYVAEDREYFGDNDLRIIFKDYDSGAASVAGMLNGEADIAFAAEFPIVRQVFNNKEIVSLGTVARYENTYILWRKDNNIKTIKNLKGKKIGVTLTTISEFYLGRTLDLNGLDIEQVTLVDIKAADAEKVLVNREVDAVVTWEPWVNQIQLSLDDQIITQSLQSDQYAYRNLVSTTDWTQNHPDTIMRLIKSLVRAEDYINGHQDEAKAMVSKQMNYDKSYVEMIWPRYQFKLSLDESLIVAMEDEARWMIEHNLTDEKKVPNFIDYIYEDALNTVHPEAVNIIR